MTAVAYMAPAYAKRATDTSDASDASDALLSGGCRIRPGAGNLIAGGMSRVDNVRVTA